MQQNGFSNQRDVRLEERGLSVRVYERKLSPEPTSTIVLIHGCGLTSLSFAALVMALEPSLHVIAYDLRAHGHTVADGTGGEDDLSLSTLVEDAKAILKRLLFPNRFTLVGHSLGVRIDWQVTEWVC